MATIKWSELGQTSIKTDQDQYVGLQNGENVRYGVPSLTQNTFDADKFNRTVDDEVVYTAATILSAVTAIGTKYSILFIKAGSWSIDQDVDLSQSNIHLILDTSATLIQNSSSVFTFPRSFQMDDYRHFVGNTGFIKFTSASSINPKPQWYGANPIDTTSNDTSALISFEQSIYDSNLPLMVLPVGVYGFNGGTSALPLAWNIRTPLLGYGSTLKQLSTAKVSSSTYSTLVANGSNMRASLTDFYIKGLRVDSNYARSGVSVHNFNTTRRFSLEDLNVEYCVSTGIRGVNVDNGGTVINCQGKYIKYSKEDADAPVVGGAADAFNFIGCDNITVIGCYAYDFRRIGFVAESNGSVKSSNMKFIACLSEYAHDENDTTDQINAGFWAENTNGADYIDCDAVNCGSGIGQTRSGGRGFVIGSGITSACLFNYDNCKVFGNTSAIGRAFSFFGTSGFNDITVRECLIDKMSQGIVIGGGINSANIYNTKFINCNTSASNDVPILINSDHFLSRLLIDNIKTVNCPVSTSDGTIKFFAVAENCDYILKNTKNITHHMSSSSGSVKSATVSNCNIHFGVNSGASFTSSKMWIEDCVFIERTGSNARLANYIGSDANNALRFDGCDITFDTNSYWQITGSVIHTFFSNCNIYNGAINIVSSGSNITDDFTNCRFYNFGGNGAIFTNFYNNIATQNLAVKGCTFNGASVEYIPIKIQSFQPRLSVFYNNGYNTSALYSDTITNVSAANNFRF